ncbi:MAG: biotin--[acetyl-CoA-carboxylase] ligase [Thermodesulfovibrionales bacterium]|nr:biotin--[acetyl-CoA-carboxylase] ligase [Thermodesulfovibrionales bacterium]
MSGIKTSLPEILKDTFIKEIIHLKDIDSTNDYTHALALKGYPNGTVVISDKQTRGRGRHQNIWHSPEGNLYMSVLLRPQKMLHNTSSMLTAFTFLGAISCVKMIAELCSLKATLKWPNDIVYQDKKLGGILTETRFTGSDVLFVIIGIGLNINSKLETFPQEITDTATSLIHLLGQKINIEEVMKTLLLKMDYYYNKLISDGLNPILKEWMIHNSTIGRKVRIETVENSYEGVAEGLDDLGRLLIKKSDGTVSAISNGHLFFL